MLRRKKRSSDAFLKPKNIGRPEVIAQTIVPFRKPISQSKNLYPIQTSKAT